MKRIPIRTMILRADDGRATRLVAALFVTALLVALFAGAVHGDRYGMATRDSDTAGQVDVRHEVDEAVETVETVTMTIDLEEGGEIDLAVPDADVLIDTWRGDDVVFIVEKRQSTAQEQGEPVNIRVTRNGKDVRIAALADASRMKDLNISFRILVPESSRHWAPDVKETYSMSKLTIVLWKALSREALRWVAR